MKEKILFLSVLCLLLTLSDCTKETITNNPVERKTDTSETTIKVRPELMALTPLDSATGVSIATVFSWTRTTVSDDTTIVYDLYVGTENPPTEKLIGDLADTTYTPSDVLAFDTSYYWKVVAKDGKVGKMDKITASEIWNFTTSPTSLFSLLTPLNSVSLVSRLPAFSWAASTDSNNTIIVYDLYVGTENPPTEKLIGDLADTTYTPSDSLEVETTYYWKIVAKNGKGGKTASEIWNFTITTPPEMVFVKGGSFEMGCSTNDCYDEQIPVHTVTLDDYYIGKYEVTWREWETVMGDDEPEWTNPDWSSTFVSSRVDDKPAQASWLEIEIFLDTLNAKIETNTGKEYRLPTEAEWEFAARGGNKSEGYTYAGSNSLLDVAWCTKNSRGLIQPVGKKQPNELGIYDMSGNVREWCSDWYKVDYYTSAPITNPTGPPPSNHRIWRVLRGGSASSDDDNQTDRKYRVDHRSGDYPHNGTSELENIGYYIRPDANGDGTISTYTRIHSEEYGFRIVLGSKK